MYPPILVLVLITSIKGFQEVFTKNPSESADRIPLLTFPLLSLVLAKRNTSLLVESRARVILVAVLPVTTVCSSLASLPATEYIPGVFPMYIIFALMSEPELYTTTTELCVVVLFRTPSMTLTFTSISVPDPKKD